MVPTWVVILVLIYRSDKDKIRCPKLHLSSLVMRTGLNLKPGEKGTKRLVAQYGDQLFRVRYRYDAARRKRLKTVELIVDEVDWEPRHFKAETMVGVRVAWGEAELAGRVKQAGGVWNRSKRLWSLRYDRALKLGLRDRIAGGI